MVSVLRRSGGGRRAVGCLGGQAGADEEKAWGCRGIQGKTGQRHDWTLGTLKRQLQVSDWQDEQQSLSEWEEGASQRSLVDECSGSSAESRRCQPPNSLPIPSGAGRPQDDFCPHLALSAMRHLPNTGFHAL